jgi:hypothetical protein
VFGDEYAKKIGARVWVGCVVNGGDRGSALDVVSQAGRVMVGK